MRWKAARLAVVLALGSSTAGCYLAHVATGQARLLHARRPVEEVLADPSTPETLARRIVRVQRAREFARALGLDVDDQYTSYAPWPGDRVVTSLVATRPGEVEPAGFDFPLVGTLPYKGFFDPERAEAEAEALRARGLDVCAFGAVAYSTLGWFDDPLTGPMLRLSEGVLVETVLHELVHATVYVEDHADWNESVARFVGEEAGVAFFAQHEGLEAAARERTRVEDTRRIASEILRLREAVGALYAREPAGPGRRAARGELEEAARGALAALPLRTREATEVAAELRLNDACLALHGTYHADTPRHAELLARLGGDLAAFIARVRRAAEAPDPRAALLADP